MIKGKVLFIASIENHFISFHIPFMKYLQGKGYEVHAATKFGKRRKELEEQNIICHNIDFSRSINLPVALISLWQLIKLMKKYKYTLVHAHTPMAAFLGRLSAKLTQISPVLYTAHGFHFYEGAPWYYWSFIYPAEYLAGKWTDGLIVMNQEDYKSAQRMGFQPKKNLFFVHGVGIDLKKINNISFSSEGIKKELNIKEEDIIISCVAEFIPNKNHIFLLKAWEKIAKEFNSIHLLFIGKGKCLNNLKKQVEQNSLPRVYFLGYRNDVPKILNKTDIITLVSKREGLPRSIMEAMALTKPIIASNIRGNRDLIEDGENGFLVELGNVDSLVSALKKLINDAELRANMGKVSFEKIKEYDIEKVLIEMASIYDYYLEKC